MENPNFHLEGVIKNKDEMQDFEGPLSLILMLLTKNKIEIRDIRIAEILDQYLEYLNAMERMDLEVASEFVQMAAHLLYIKTRMLLAGDEEEVSELELLIASLEQLKAKDTLSNLRELLPELKKASETGLLYMEKLPEPIQPPKEYSYRHEPYELLKALRNIWSRSLRPPEDEGLEQAVPKKIVYSVRDKSRELVSVLRSGPLRMTELYAACTSRSEIVATFISVLELCSMGSLHIDRTDGELTVSFTGGEVEDILEKIVE